MKRITIMRGVPGSGKSSWVERQHGRDVTRPLAREANAGRAVAVVSADDAFVGADRRYVFDKARLQEVHDRCLAAFKALLVDDTTDVVVVDNTGISPEHVAPYYEAAKGSPGVGEVRIVTVRCPAAIAIRRQKHGVPAAVVKALAAKLERSPILFAQPGELVSVDEAAEVMAKKATAPEVFPTIFEALTNFGGGKPEQKTFEHRVTCYSDLFYSAKVGGRMAKASELLGKIEPGESMHVISSGEWSAEHVIAHFADQIGPCELVFAAWYVSNEAAEILIRAHKNGFLTSITGILDSRVKGRDPEPYRQLIDAAGAKIYTTATHAKMYCLLNERAGVGITIVGSANLCTNPRIEAYVVTSHLELARFHRRWITDAIGVASAFERGQMYLFKDKKDGGMTGDRKDIRGARRIGE